MKKEERVHDNQAELRKKKPPLSRQQKIKSKSGRSFAFKPKTFRDEENPGQIGFVYRNECFEFEKKPC